MTVFADSAGVLEGAQVLNGAGRVVATISSGTIAAPFTLDDGFFLLRLSDGKLAELRHENVE